MSQTYSFGALAPKIDIRDYSIVTMASNYPAEYQVDWRPAIKNQGSVGSCVAHATSEILEWFHRNETGRSDRLSTDFIYGMQGVAFGREKSGMYLRDACKIAHQYGDCYKATIGTNIEQPECTAKLKAKLNDEIYNEAYQFHIQSYAQCKTDDAIKHAIMNYGPVLASIEWYQDFKLLPNKVIQFDYNSKKSYHAIMVYGWNKNGWLCQNSWGKTWNGDGTFVQKYEPGLREAWSFVDAKNDSNIKMPKRYTIFNFIIKIINYILNLFQK